MCKSNYTELKKGLGRVSSEIQAGVDKGYLGAIKDDPLAQELIEQNKHREMPITVRDTVNTRCSCIKPNYGKGWDIYNRLNKGYPIPQRYIDETTDPHKKKYYQDHNKGLSKMYTKEYTIYVDEDDKIIKLVSGHALEDVACRDIMMSLGDRVTLIRVRDKK